MDNSNADTQKYTIICSERVVIGNTLVPATVHFECVLLCPLRIFSNFIDRIINLSLSLLTNHRNGVIVKVEDGKATAPPEGAVFHDFGDLVIMPGT